VCGPFCLRLTRCFLCPLACLALVPGWVQGVLPVHPGGDRGAGAEEEAVDTALKGAAGCRQSRTTAATHDPEREVLEGVMVVSIADAKGRAPGQGERHKQPRQPQPRHAPHVPRTCPWRAGLPLAPATWMTTGEGACGPVRPSVEVRQRKQRKVVLVDEGQRGRAGGVPAEFKVVEEGEGSSGDEGGSEDRDMSRAGERRV